MNWYKKAQEYEIYWVWESSPKDKEYFDVIESEVLKLDVSLEYKDQLDGSRVYRVSNLDYDKLPFNGKHYLPIGKNRGFTLREKYFGNGFSSNEGWQKVIEIPRIKDMAEFVRIINQEDM